MLSQRFVDNLIVNFQQGLRSFAQTPLAANRPMPGQELAEDTLNTTQKKLSLGLMRVNHSGEICAQALYQGQAWTARSQTVKTKLQQSAEEEIDHLAWCQQRINALGGRNSYLNLLWYLGSLTIGSTAGLIGDRWSLGFLAETERQVVEHLESHLQRLPTDDYKSRKIIEQMIIDESEHANIAVNNGAQELPSPIKRLMRLCSKVMTKLSFYL